MSIVTKQRRNVIERQSPFHMFLKTDSYKIGMDQMYAPGITEVYSFIESRGGKFDELVVAGVDSFIDRYLTNPLTEADVEELADFFALRPEPFNEVKFRELLSINGGMLPLEIKALPEGTVVPVSVPMVSVCSTVPEAKWLATVVETLLLSHVWYMSTVATLAREIKKILKAANDETSPGFEGLNFQLHNFGDRGATPGDSATYGGAAHLMLFMGTDSLAATRYVQVSYKDGQIHGFSVPASEHSISCSWKDDERGYLLNMIRTFKEKFDIISVVSDTYDVYGFVEMALTDPEVKVELDDLAARGKRLVFRPDSGEATEVLPKILDIMEKNLPVTVNEAGYKVLSPHIGILQGDSVSYETIGPMLDAIKAHGWASQNLVFGMGGKLVQAGLNRDTQKFAMKASNIIQDGVSVGIAKNPVTAAWKKSKKGKFSVVVGELGHLTWRAGEGVSGDKLTVRYKDGWVAGYEDFSEVKRRADIV